MGGGHKSWPYQWPIYGQTPDFNATSAWTIEKHLSNYVDPWHNAVATNRSFSVSPMADHSQPQIGQAEPRGLSYCLPSSRQAIFLPSNSPHTEQALTEHQAVNKKDENLYPSSQFPQKKFLVFDQTGDQTTMIYCSGVGAPPVHCLSCREEQQAEAYVFHPQQEGVNVVRNLSTHLLDGFIDINEFGKDHGSDLQSEMHEDTEELNALMYSDDDAYSDEDDVNSTGHSPSVLTGHEKQHELVGIIEEVASSDEEPRKRQKLSNGGSGLAQIEGRISLTHGTSIFEGDTESYCGNGKTYDSGKIISQSSNKRARKDLVRETVRALQSMIPEGKGTTPIEVIDESIHFLISLKLKAKGLGFDSM